MIALFVALAIAAPVPPPTIVFSGQRPRSGLARSSRCELRIAGTDWRGSCLLRKGKVPPGRTDASFRVYPDDRAGFPGDVTELQVAIMRPGLAVLTGYVANGRQVLKTPLTKSVQDPACWEAENYRICAA